MIITSRKSKKTRATKIEVRDVKCEMNPAYHTLQHYSGNTFNVMTSQNGYLELVIRVPLDPNEFQDMAKLRDRMYNLHKAELLELE